MTDRGSVSDWAVLHGTPVTWFDASSLGVVAAFASQVVNIDPSAIIELRACGARVHLTSTEFALDVSDVATGLGLRADPAGLQYLDLVFQAREPGAIQDFWQHVLGYERDSAGGLADPLRLDPDASITQLDGPRPVRNRIHLDVVRPQVALEALGLGDGDGPYGVLHRDSEGNEVDVVPGDSLGDTAETSDWHNVFSTMACYRTGSTQQQGELAKAAATLADDAGFPLFIDLRPSLVILSTGKDQSDADAHGLDLDFEELAARLQAAARSLGAMADLTLPRYVQAFFDAADVPTVRAFWIATLGYRPDRRAEVTDIADPRGIGPALVFQELDATEAERRAQRNRIHLQLRVPGGQLPLRRDAALEAGGRVLQESTGRLLIADPEGNELALIAMA